MHTMTKIALSLCGCLALASATTAQSRFTPSEYRVVLHGVDLSTDGTSWTGLFASPSGQAVDLADPNAFANALGNATAIAAGTYPWIRMTLGTTLTWSHPAPPVSTSEVPVTVNGPPGPQPGQMTAYFATHDQGGRPNADGGGDGTASQPFLLGAPARITADSNTVLRMVFAVSDTLKDQGGGNYDLAPPLMFFVAENDSASKLSGSFNTVLYNAEKTVDGNTTEAWNYCSGRGTLAFDGAGTWTWAGITNEYDLLNTSGSLDPAKTRSGRYGINDDGSFWMIATGEPGTLHGAVSADGEMLFASMYDSPSSHLMFFGVGATTNAAIASLTGSYYFTTYGSRYDDGASQLSFTSSFGIVTSDGSGAVSGVQDVNTLRVTDPTGTPSFIPPATSLGDPFADTLAVTSGGVLSNSGGNLSGGLLASADAACIGWSFATPHSPSHEFGFLVRQSPSGTFSTASLQGTYFGGHFGDRYRSDAGGSSRSFSGFFKVSFDGQGGATVTLLENLDGTIEATTVQQSYSVDSATGIVSFTHPDNGPESIKGAIGPNASSFILTAEQQFSGQANEQRFLGIGVKQ